MFHIPLQPEIPKKKGWNKIGDVSGIALPIDRIRHILLRHTENDEKSEEYCYEGGVRRGKKFTDRSREKEWKTLFPFESGEDLIYAIVNEIADVFEQYQRKGVNLSLQKDRKEHIASWEFNPRCAEGIKVRIVFRKELYGVLKIKTMYPVPDTPVSFCLNQLPCPRNQNESVSMRPGSKSKNYHKEFHQQHDKSN